MSRIDFGLDAPVLVRTFAGVGVGMVAAVAALAFLVGWPAGVPGGLLAVAAAAGPVYCLGLAAYMVYGSRVVKVRNRPRLLDLVPWTGAEHVLDIGCGRGLLLVGAAGRLTTGAAVGIDLWRAADQAANTPAATLENARRAGVADRVRVETADMCSLPFADATFDVVLSHWAVHNVPDAAGRGRAAAEIARVLKPGGHVVLADISGLAEVTAALTAHGLAGVRVVGAGWPAGVLGVVTFGSFRPEAVVGRKPG